MKMLDDKYFLSFDVSIKKRMKRFAYQSDDGNLCYSIILQLYDIWKESP